MREQHGAGRGRLENCTWAPPPKRKREGGRESASSIGVMGAHHRPSGGGGTDGRAPKKEGEAVVPFLSSISASDGMEGGETDAGRGMFRFLFRSRTD